MPTVEATALLRAADVVLDDRTVLRAIDLEIAPGITLLRGHNGAGKTTLLRALAGLVPLARGTRRAPAEVLYLGHRPQLHRSLSAAENLSFFARYRIAAGRAPVPSGPRRGGVTEAVADALAAWGVPLTRRPAERLSAGQRRRAALARIDTEQCPLVLLDEPFAELDDEASVRLTAVIAAAGRRGQAVVIATHGHADLPFDRTVVLGSGAMVPA